MKIRDGYDRFRKNAYPQHAELFEQLAGGQQPETLFITCSGSRIDPSLITQTLPGELFVIRNAGNFASTRQASGVVAAALAPDSLADLPYVAAWLGESGPKVAGLEGRFETLDAAASRV